MYGYNVMTASECSFLALDITVKKNNLLKKINTQIQFHFSFQQNSET